MVIPKARLLSLKLQRRMEKRERKSKPSHYFRLQSLDHHSTHIRSRDLLYSVA